MSRTPTSMPLPLALYGIGAVDWQGAVRRTGWPYRSPLDHPRRSALLVLAAAGAGVVASLAAGRAAAAVAGVPPQQLRRLAAMAPLGLASPLPLGGLALQAAAEATLGRSLAESAVVDEPAADGGPSQAAALQGPGLPVARVGRAVAGMAAWAATQAAASVLAGRVLDVVGRATDAHPWIGADIGATTRASRPDAGPVSGAVSTPVSGGPVSGGPVSGPVAAPDAELDVVGPDVTPEGPEGYVVYLDGVGRYQARTTPTGRALAGAVTDRLPRWRVVLSVMPSDVTQRPVTERPITGPLWRRLERTRREGRVPLALRGIWEALVALDPRYVERICHDQTGNLLAALLAAGYEPGSGRPIVVVGYSGGAQIALRTASAVARGVGGAPVDVVTFGAFADGSADLGGVRRVHAAVSWGDPAELLPVLLFPSRWTALGIGAWSAAQRRRAVVVRRHDYATHLGRTGYLSPHATTPDGRSRLAQAADLVATAARELTGDRHARFRGVRQP